MSNDGINILDSTLASTIGVPSNNTANSQGSEPNKAAASEKECIDPDKAVGRKDVSKPNKAPGCGDCKKLLKGTTFKVAVVAVVLVVGIGISIVVIATKFNQRLEHLENNSRGTGTAVEVFQQLEALQQNISDLNNRFSELQTNYTKQEAQLQYSQTNQANQTMQNREEIETNADGFASLDRKVAEQKERLNSSIRDTGQKLETIQEATAEAFAALDGKVAEQEE